MNEDRTPRREAGYPNLHLHIQRVKREFKAETPTIETQQNTKSKTSILDCFKKKP